MGNNKNSFCIEPYIKCTYTKEGRKRHFNRTRNHKSQIMKSSKFVIYLIKGPSSSVVRAEGTWEEWPDIIWRNLELNVKLCGEKLEKKWRAFLSIDILIITISKNNNSKNWLNFYQELDFAIQILCRRAHLILIIKFIFKQ